MSDAAPTICLHASYKVRFESGRWWIFVGPKHKRQVIKPHSDDLFFFVFSGDLVYIKNKGKMRYNKSFS